MQQIQWTSSEYNSTETCIITKTDLDIQVTSFITGNYENKKFEVSYRLVIDYQWQILSGEIKYKINEENYEFHFIRAAGAQWIINGITTSEFTEAIDIDISLTPFTNSLPINRLELFTNAPVEVDVVYFDILMQEVRLVKQRYTRLAADTYKFENVPNDFEAEISVDDLGLVTEYPGLFKRVVKPN